MCLPDRRGRRRPAAAAAGAGIWAHTNWAALPAERRLERDEARELRVAIATGILPNKIYEVAPYITTVNIGALYIGGMGARGKNFYNDYAKRLGYEEEAVQIQDLYLAGKKAEAMALVPNELVDAIALIGPKERIRDRLEAWKASPVKTLLVGAGQPEALRVLAELAL